VPWRWLPGQLQLLHGLCGCCRPSRCPAEGHASGRFELSGCQQVQSLQLLRQQPQESLSDWHRSLPRIFASASGQGQNWLGHLHLQPDDKCCPNACVCVWSAASLWKIWKSHAIIAYWFLSPGTCIVHALCRLPLSCLILLHPLQSYVMHACDALAGWVLKCQSGVSVLSNVHLAESTRALRESASSCCMTRRLRSLGSPTAMAR
jgi:hypothetical protein